MSFCIYGHPDRNGGPGVELPILVFDDGVNQVFMNPGAFVRCANEFRFLAPVVLADALAVTTRAANLDMIVQAIETTVTLDVNGVTSSIDLVRNGQVLNPPNKVGVVGSVV